jgi:hypothetical protein
MITIEQVIEQCAQVIDQQDVDPSFKHRMASHIRALAAQYERLHCGGVASRSKNNGRCALPRTGGDEMTRDEIIKLAQEAGEAEGMEVVFHPVMARFAALVAEAEREACAKLAESLPMQQEIDVRDQCSAAIRARGEK